MPKNVCHVLMVFKPLNVTISRVFLLSVKREFITEILFLLANGWAVIRGFLSRLYDILSRIFLSAQALVPGPDKTVSPGSDYNVDSRLNLSPKPHSKVLKQVEHHFQKKNMFVNVYCSSQSEQTVTCKLFVNIKTTS